jgi:hypothetical protein
VVSHIYYMIAFDIPAHMSIEHNVCVSCIISGHSWSYGYARSGSVLL